MVKTDEFKEWLKKNTTYTDAVISDTVSRVKRADNCLEIYNEDVYQFYLEKDEHYRTFSVAVRSQIKKAVSLYQKFLNE